MTNKMPSEMKDLMAKLQPIGLPPLPEHPLVSVLITNYNYAQYIGEALESVLNQTYQNFEIIIVDDGSTDNSLEVIRRYAEKDRRIKYIAKENGGVASALNWGYEIAQGDIICFLDADDLFNPDKMDVVREVLQKAQNSGFLIHPVEQIDETKISLGIYPLTGKLLNGWIGSEMIEEGGIVEFPPVSGLVIRKEIAKFIFPINERFRTNADGVIQRLAPLITEVLSIQRPLAKRRVHRTNVTYSRNISPEYLYKSIEIERTLWGEQAKFLKEWLAIDDIYLKDYEQTFSFKTKQYILKRLLKDPEWKTLWSNFVKSSEFKQLSLVRRTLWYFSAFVPFSILPWYINLWFSSNRLKFIATRMLQFLR